MVLFDLALSSILFAGFACYRDYFSGNILILKRNTQPFFSLGLIVGSSSSSSSAPALCVCKRHIAISTFAHKRKENKCNLSPTLLPPIVPSYTSLLDFPHLLPKLGFLDTFFILQHSFQLHDLYNSFTSYSDSSLLSLPVQGTPQPCAPLFDLPASEA